MMPRAPSEAIDDIAYEPDSATLFVRFVEGGLYAYFGVPAAVHRGFVGAASLGRFFQDEVRGRYAYRRIG